MRTISFSIFTVSVLLLFAYFSVLINVNPAGFLLIGLLVVAVNLLQFFSETKNQKRIDGKKSTHKTLHTSLANKQIGAQ